jgi:hypothetical protein
MVKIDSFSIQECVLVNIVSFSMSGMPCGQFASFSIAGMCWSHSWWMAARLATLPATQVARVPSLVPAGPTFSVEKVGFFVDPVSGTSSQALQSRL